MSDEIRYAAPSRPRWIPHGPGGLDGHFGCSHFLVLPEVEETPAPTERDLAVLAEMRIPEAPAL